MPALHVRNVPEETIAVLKKRAAAHGRSLEAELRAIFDAAAAGAAERVDVSFRDRIVMSDAPVTAEFERSHAYSDELIDGR